MTMDKDSGQLNPNTQKQVSKLEDFDQGIWQDYINFLQLSLLQQPPFLQGTYEHLEYFGYYHLI